MDSTLQKSRLVLLIQRSEALRERKSRLIDTMGDRVDTGSEHVVQDQRDR